MKILNSKVLLQFLLSHKSLGLLADLSLFPLILLMYIIKFFHKSDIDRYLPKRNRQPIILVHGSGANEAQWLITSLYLKNMYDVYMVQLNDLPADASVGLDRMRVKVENKIEQIRKHNQQKIILVGHSMGGLIAALSVEKLSDHIDRIITINTPWNGASMLNNVMFETLRHQQMLPNSDLTWHCQKIMNDNNINLTVVYNEYDMQVHKCDANPKRVANYKSIEYGCGHTNVIVHKKLWRLLGLI